MAKVIHVHLLHKIDGTKQKDWYFSSISAVYTVLTADQVGATKNYLLHAGLSGNGTICTKKAIIKQSTLISGGCLLVRSRGLGDVYKRQERYNSAVRKACRRYFFEC